jgi:hypothetical protein
MRAILCLALLAGCVAESDDPDTFGSSTSSTPGEGDESGSDDTPLEMALAECDAAMGEESKACADGMHEYCVVYDAYGQDDPCCDGDPDFQAMCEPYPCHTDPDHETPQCRLGAPSGCDQNLCYECMRGCDDDPDCDLEEYGWECVAEISWP